MSIDIRDPITSLLSDNSIEEDILGDAEIGTVGEEFIPWLSKESRVKLLEIYSMKIFSKKPCHEDVIQSCSFHQSKMIFDGDFCQCKPNLWKILLTKQTGVQSWIFPTFFILHSFVKMIRIFFSSKSFDMNQGCFSYSFLDINGHNQPKN